MHTHMHPAAAAAVLDNLVQNLRKSCHAAANSSFHALSEGMVFLATTPSDYLMYASKNMFS